MVNHSCPSAKGNLNTFNRRFLFETASFTFKKEGIKIGERIKPIKVQQWCGSSIAASHGPKHQLNGALGDCSGTLKKFCFRLGLGLKSL